MRTKASHDVDVDAALHGVSQGQVVFRVSVF